MGYIDWYKRLHELQTDASLDFAEFNANFLIGSHMGYWNINDICPNVRHNMYMLLIGRSQKARKDTSQNIAMSVSDPYYSIANDLTPERFIEELSKKQHSIQWYGEFSSLLKGINSKGHYMSRMVEIMNHIQKCKPYTKGKVGNGDGETDSVIPYPYFNFHSTITEEMQTQFLTTEYLGGGIGARMIHVHGKNSERARGRTPPEVYDLQKKVKGITKIISLFREPQVFTFDDEALTEYNKISDSWNNKYSQILPFVGCYLDYMVAIADIKLISDLVDPLFYLDLQELQTIISNFFNPDNSAKLVKISKFSKLVNDLVEQDIIKSNYILYNGNNSTTYLYYSTNYTNLRADSLLDQEGPKLVKVSNIRYAQKLLEKSLDYVVYLQGLAMKKPCITQYLKFVRENAPCQRSKILTYGNLDAQEVDTGFETGLQREEVFRFNFKKEKFIKPTEVHCLHKYLNTEKCASCIYKKLCEENRQI